MQPCPTYKYGIEDIVWLLMSPVPRPLSSFPPRAYLPVLTFTYCANDSACCFSSILRYLIWILLPQAESFSFFSSTFLSWSTPWVLHLSLRDIWGWMDLLWRPVSCIVGCLVTQCLCRPPPVWQKCLHTLPAVPSGAEHRCWEPPVYTHPPELRRHLGVLLCRAVPLISVRISPTGHASSLGTIFLPWVRKTFRVPAVRSSFAPSNCRIWGNFSLGLTGFHLQQPWAS